MELLDDLDHELPSGKEEWALFVQDKKEYYVPLFEQFSTTNKIAEFNLAAAVGGFFWATYRKMFFLALFQVFLFFLLTELFGAAIIIIGFFLYGFFGDWIYYQHCRRKIEAIRRKELQQSRRNTEMIKKGGVSLIVPIAIIVGFIGFFVFLLAAFDIPL